MQLVVLRDAIYAVEHTVRQMTQHRVSWGKHRDMMRLMSWHKKEVAGGLRKLSRRVKGQVTLSSPDGNA
jgi:uncharacterized protein with von Willebrand factor type A (vWA) domain